MKRSIARSLFVAVAVFVSSVAYAAPADDALASLLQARQSLVTLLDTGDAGKRTELEAAIAKASQAVDASVAAGLADKAATAENSAKLKEFKKVWEDFKKTRDSEIIPAVKAGKVDVAKGLAKGIQAERLAKMKELLAALGAK